MLKLVVGQNTIGKTLELKRQLEECQKHNPVVTNLYDDYNLKQVSYNIDRVNALKELVFPDEDVLISGEKLSIGSADLNTCVPGHSSDLEELLTLLCKDINFVFLDEPDKNLNYADKLLLINFVGRVQHTFNEIWIVTHYEGFMFIPDRDVYTVQMAETTSTTKLIRVPEGKEFEVID
jgi:predicted ATPase